jgi:hypothetical protein
VKNKHEMNKNALRQQDEREWSFDESYCLSTFCLVSALEQCKNNSYFEEKRADMQRIISTLKKRLDQTGFDTLVCLMNEFPKQKRFCKEYIDELGVHGLGLWLRQWERPDAEKLWGVLKGIFSYKQQAVVVDFYLKNDDLLKRLIYGTNELGHFVGLFGYFIYNFGLNYVPGSYGCHWMHLEKATVSHWLDIQSKFHAFFKDNTPILRYVLQNIDAHGIDSGHIFSDFLLFIQVLRDSTTQKMDELLQGSIVKILLDDNGRLFVNLTCIYGFDYLLERVASQHQTIVDCLLTKPKFLKRLLRYKSFDEVLTSLPNHHEAFVSYIVNQPEVFKREIGDISCLSELLQLVPSQRDAFVQYLLDQPAEFKRLVDSPDSLECLLRACSDHGYTVFKYVCSQPAEFERLLRDSPSSVMNSLSYDHRDRVVKYICNDPVVFKRLVYSVYVLKGLLEFIDLDLCNAIAEHVVNHAGEFDRLMRDSSDLRVLVGKCYKFPHKYIFRQYPLRNARIAKSTFDTKQTVLREMSILPRARVLSQLAAEHSLSALSELPEAILFLIMQFSAEYPFSRSMNLKILNEITQTIDEVKSLRTEHESRTTNHETAPLQRRGCFIL